MTLKTENFPAELKPLQNWVLWAYENGTKVPYNPKNLRKAKSSDSKTWGTLDQALAMLDKNPELFGGVGIVPTDGILVLDFDNVAQEGRIPDQTLEALKKANTYTEYSPSGNGLRLLFHQPEGSAYVNIPKQKVDFYGMKEAEAWNGGKYATLTGNLVAPELNRIVRANGFVSELMEHLNATVTATGNTSGGIIATVPRGTESPEAVWDILERISADCPHEEWLKAGMGIHSWDSGEAGEALWHKWSKTAPQRYERKQADTSWKSFRTAGNSRGRVTLGTLRHMADRYPLDAFPPVVREMIADVARVTETPVELGGPLALGVLSGCVGKGLVVREVFGGNDALPTIQVFLFMASGGGKSSAFKPFHRQMDEWTRQMREEHRIQARKLKAQADAIRTEAEINRKTYGKSRDPKLVLENEKLEKELAELEKRMKPTEYVVEDVTPERLAVILGNNGFNGQESVFSFSGDARKALAVVLGCYKKERNAPDDQLYVKGFTWEAHNQQRQDEQRSVDLQAPALPLLWLLQPDQADRLLTNPELMASGFIQRLTMDRIHHEAQERKAVSKENPAVRKAWDGLVFDVLEKFRIRNQPVQVEAEEGVRELMLDYYNENVRRIQAGEWRDVETVVKRFMELAWRFALLLHVASHGKEADKALTMETARNGIRLARYYGNRKLALMLASRESRDRERLERVKELAVRLGHVTGRFVAQRLHEWPAGVWTAWMDKQAHKGELVREEHKPEGGGPVSVRFCIPPATQATNATNVQDVVRS